MYMSKPQNITVPQASPKAKKFFNARAPGTFFLCYSGYIETKNAWEHQKS